MKDKNNIIKTTYSGAYSNVWSPWIEGDAVKIQLKSDSSVTGYGFRIDKYEYATATTQGTNRKVAILLTDGYHNTGTHPNDVVPLYKTKGWPIYSIALTGDADETLLKSIASETGGKFKKAVTADALQEIYNNLKQVVKKQSTIQSLSSTISQNQIVSQNVLVDNSVKSIDVSVSWQGSDLDLILYYPNGTEVVRNTSSSTGTNDLNITYINASTYEIYTVNNPMPGNWSYKIKAVSVIGNESFTAIVAATTTLTLTAGANKAAYYINEPVTITATLTNSTSGIGNANITAEITQPNGNTEKITQFNDLGSGSYRISYTNTSRVGSYSAKVKANLSGITRIASVDFSVNSSAVGINVTPAKLDFSTVYPGDSKSSVLTVRDLSSNSSSTYSLNLQYFLKEIEKAGEIKLGGTVINKESVSQIQTQAELTSGIITIGDFIGAGGRIEASNVTISQPVISLPSGGSLNITITLNIP